MTESLIVVDGEALSLARELAQRRGSSVDEAVVASLRTSLLQVQSRDRIPEPVQVPTLEQLTPEQRARYEANRAWVREIAKDRVPGGTSDHSHMYDENGLPI